MKKLLLIITLVAVSAIAALADTITMQSFGTMNLGGTTFTANSAISYWAHISGSLPLATLQGGSETEAGTLNGTNLVAGYSSNDTYANIGNTDSLTIAMATTSVVYQSTYGFYSVAGTWNYTSGTGSYAGLAGSGTFAATITPLNGSLQIDLKSMNGNLQAAPEPVSLGAVAIGLIGLVVRKRK